MSGNGSGLTNLPGTGTVAVTAVADESPILMGSGDNNTDTSKSVQVPSSTDYPKINGSNGRIIAPGGFFGDLLGSADTVEVQGSFNSSNNRPIACFGGSSNPNIVTKSNIVYAETNPPTIRGDVRISAPGGIVADLTGNASRLMLQQLLHKTNLNGFR